ACPDRFGVAAAEHGRDVRRSESLADPRDARQDLPCHGYGVLDELELAQTDIAGAAVVLPVLLAEVIHQVTVAAPHRRGISLHVRQQTTRARRELAVALEHDAPLHEGGGRVAQHALGFEPIAAGPARLLLLVLQR